MKKYFSLKENEELILGSNANKKTLSISCKNDVLYVKEIEEHNELDNIEIKIVNYDELKKFILFETYYQDIAPNCEKTNMKKINDILDNHYKKLYGDRYDKEYMDVIDTKFQVITIYENKGEF